MADLLKFVFAIIIVLYHSKNLVEVEGTSIFTLGVISVDFFFLVSGYFLAVGIDKKPYAEGVTLGQDTRNFMLHKICGFLPNYYIAWVIAFIVRHLYRAPYSGSVAVDLLEGIRELNFLEMTGIGEGGYIVNNVTWYLSAMLVAMLLLYPLGRKYKDTYFYIIAPIIVLLLYGFLFQNYLNLKKPYYWVAGLMMKGTIRAFADIAFGCIIYKAASFLKSKQYTAVTKTIFTLLEIAMWGGSMWYMYKHLASKHDYDLVLMFAFGLLITMGGLSWSSDINWGKAGEKITAWLGEFSFSLFLGHGFWSQSFDKLFNAGDWAYKKKLVIYFAIAIATGLFIMYSSKLLRYIWDKNKEKITSVFVRKQIES